MGTAAVRHSLVAALVKSLFAILLTGFVPTAFAAPAPVATTLPREKMQPFLQEYCIRCHGPEKQKGQVRFDTATWEITGNDSGQRWQDVLDVLNGGNMPPKDEPRPDPARLAAMLGTLTDSLLLARKRLTDHGGEIAMRRLNRREYAGTIRELFGFDVPLAMLPEDGEVQPFDTVGKAQFFTSSHFDKYLELGRDLVAHGFAWAGKPRAATTIATVEPEERVTKPVRAALAELDRRMQLKNEGKTWQEIGFEDEGEMKVFLDQFQTRAGKPRQYLALPFVERGIYLTDVNNETRRYGTNRDSDPRGTYRFRIRAGLHGTPPEIRQFVCVTDREGIVGVVKITGTPEQPGTVELTYRPNVQHKSVSLAVEENRADIRVLEGYLKKLGEGGEWASIWIDRLEIEGPFYDRERAFFETLIYPTAPVRGKTPGAWTDTTARQLIEQFAFTAFRRRAPAPAFVDQLVGLFEKNRAAGAKFEQAMGEALAVVLASPGFLFLQEASGPQRKKRTLEPRELAIRLAYFLWSSPPDAVLYQCAEDGSLARAEVLQAQVDRMLDDPKALRFFAGFTSQWAALPRFDAITVNEAEHVRFNKGLRHSAYREVLEFCRVLVQENLPASRWISSDFAVVNAHLAEHYGLPGVTSDAFQKVRLPADSPRGGLLGQTAFLTLGSNGERSSPVIRGALVMEKLLHDKPAPPPPNVPELGAASKTPATNRDMVRLHQSRAQCASCHQKMDVIGFGLENFDVIGKWRDTEPVGRKQVPIEPGGTLPNGAAFKDIAGLKAVLLQHDHRLAEELVEALLAYGLGRTIEFSDQDAVAAVLAKLKPDGYRVRSMIHEIAASPVFRTK
ncbi:MAG: hypothetical protein RL077_642 [Verrucomicrobiota bacterium]|jgi:hypothetical protein